MSRDDGYEITTQPRRPRLDGLSHFAIVERDGTDPDAAPAGRVNRCQSCHVEGVSMILHADPDSSDPRRCICGKCQGEANLRRCGLQPRNER
jgi:hypothetical protein